MVAREFVHAWQFDHLLFHTAVTVGEVLAGFILGSLLGAVIGYLLGMSPTAEFALSPYILALQIAPKVAFAPLFILWMGFTVYPKILVAILIVFFPVMVNVLTAVRGVDPDLINLARSFKATRAQIFWKVEFPTSMPPMFAGLRIGSTLEDLEKIDGAPFHITGFGGLRDGMAGFTGKLAKLTGGCSVGGNFEPTAKLPKREMNNISGDDDFLSSNPIMRRAKPKTHQVDVTYQP